MFSGIISNQNVGGGFSITGYNTSSVVGSYTFLYWTSSGTCTVTGSGTVDVLLVGAGGNGMGCSSNINPRWSGSCGGAGEVQHYDDYNIGDSVLNITVGQKGTSIPNRSTKFDIVYTVVGGSNGSTGSGAINPMPNGGTSGNGNPGGTSNTIDPGIGGGAVSSPVGGGYVWYDGTEYGHGGQKDVYSYYGSGGIGEKTYNKFNIEPGHGGIFAIRVLTSLLS